MHNAGRAATTSMVDFLRTWDIEIFLVKVLAVALLLSALLTATGVVYTAALYARHFLRFG